MRRKKEAKHIEHSDKIRVKPPEGSEDLVRPSLLTYLKFE